MKPTKVLHLITWLVRGGLEMWLLDMLRILPRTAWEMDVCCKGHDVGYLTPLARELGANVLHCPLGPTTIPFVRRLTRILRQGRYDILHVHISGYCGPAVWAARKAQIPVITTFHNTLFAPSLWWTRLPVLSHLRRLYFRYSISYALRHSDVVTGVSRGVLDSVCGSRRLPPRRARVLYLGTPTPAPLSPKERHSLRIALAPHGPLILHVGRFCRQKNHSGILDVFERVLKSAPNAHLILVGDGPLRDAVERDIKKRRLGHSVRVLGLRSDVPSIMQSSDVLLFPSFHEGLPIVLTEASAAGLPVVTSRIPGITEAIEDGLTGLLHDVQDVDGMATSVLKILHEPDFRRKLADAGKTRHAARFSMEAAADRLTALYQDVLNDRASSHGTTEPPRAVRSRFLPALTCETHGT